MLFRVVLLVVLLCGSASAQIVNVQGALAKAPENDGVSGEGSLKLSWREGNSPFFDIGGSGVALVRHGDFLELGLVRGEYGRSRGLTLTEKTFEHLRERYTIDCRWRWEVFGQHEFDRFRRLNLRVVMGTGPALQIVNDENFGLLAGVAYIFEIEHLDEREGTFDRGNETTAHRASFYLTGHEDIAKNVAIVETVYVQPRIDKPSDLRIFGELSVQTKLSKHIALKDSLVIAYDDTPPDQVERFDSAVEVALLVSF